MRSLRSLGEGFLIGSGVVWSFNILSLLRSGDAWQGMLYLMILAIPISALLYFKLKHTESGANVEVGERWRNLLFSVQGAALAFWGFDIITTFYAINVTGLAVELNPLGWPLGLLGAFAYYGPTTAFLYVLLFKVKLSISVYAAVPLTLMTISMSIMNLLAGAHNFQVFVETAALAVGLRFGLLTALGTVCLMVPFALKRADLRGRLNF